MLDKEIFVVFTYMNICLDTLKLVTVAGDEEGGVVVQGWRDTVFQ